MSRHHSKGKEEQNGHTANRLDLNSRKERFERNSQDAERDGGEREGENFHLAVRRSKIRHKLTSLRFQQGYKKK